MHGNCTRNLSQDRVDEEYDGVYVPSTYVWTVEARMRLGIERFQPRNTEYCTLSCMEEMSLSSTTPPKRNQYNRILHYTRITCFIDLLIYYSTFNCFWLFSPDDLSPVTRTSVLAKTSTIFLYYPITRIICNSRWFLHLFYFQPSVIFLSFNVVMFGHEFFNTPNPTNHLHRVYIVSFHEQI